MGKSVVNRVVNLLPLTLTIGLVFNVTCLLGKPLTRKARQTERNCVYNGFVAIMTSDLQYVLTVSARGRGVELRNVTEHPITLENLFINSEADECDGRYRTFTAFAKRRNLTVDENGNLTVRNDSTIFYREPKSSNENGDQYYLFTATTRMDGMRVVCEKSEPVAIDKEQNRDIFHLEDVSRSKFLSAELKQLCCDYNEE